MAFDFPALELDNIRSFLITRRERLAVAESVTAGLLQAAFASVKDASLFFEGGLTAYNIDQKIRHLGIDPKEGASCNCVSEQIAREMATGACRLFRADWGIAVTGYATPVKEADFELYAFFAVAHQGSVKVSLKINLSNLDADAAQMEYTNRVISYLSEHLLGGH